MRKLTLVVMTLALAANLSFAGQDDRDAATPGPKKCPKLQASTIFVPDKSFNRKKGSAKKISEAHKVAEAQGWSFDEMSVYIEDGDLQGFFITYTREHPCNTSTPSTE